MKVKAMADPIGTIKNISEVIKKYNDIGLMRQISELEEEVFDLQRENLALRKQLDAPVKIQRKGPLGYYFEDGSDEPLCPRCWEKDGKAIRLPALTTFLSKAQGRMCRVCKEQYFEVPAPPGGQRILPRTQWS
jgi:hypothetical protein